MIEEEGLPARIFRHHKMSGADVAPTPWWWRTVRDLVVALFPKVTAVNVFLAYSEVLGFLMYLEDKGRVERIAGRLRDRYRLIPR